jgi:hypothetical protein
MSVAESQVFDFPIEGTGPLSRDARSRGYRQFAEVAEAVRSLPYGRPRDSQNVLAVFEEQRGTCSSKHRYLAALAHECGHTEVKLMLGLYAMSDNNTPGVGAVLGAAGIAAIPEAHCYLMCGERRFDYTGLPSGGTSPFESLLDERPISPRDLPSVKFVYHRGAVADWARGRGIDPDSAWALREKCIELLANSTPHADARASAEPCEGPSARAGGRGR